MIIFKGFDGDEFMGQVGNTYQDNIGKYNEMKHLIPYLILLAVISFILSIYIIVFRSVLVLVTTFALCCLFVIKAIMKELKRDGAIPYEEYKSLVKNRFQVHIDNDLVFHIIENGVEKVCMKDVEEVIFDSHTYSYRVEGEFQGIDGIYDYYIINCALRNCFTLKLYLDLSTLQKNSRMFRNDTLKNVMHMEKELQEKYLIKELDNGSYILACTLNEAIGLPFEYSSEIRLHSAHDQNYILLFTSMDEIPDEVKEKYKIYLIVSLSNLRTYFHKNDSHVFDHSIFNENITQTFKGCIINIENERIKLDDSLMQRIILENRYKERVYIWQ